LLSKNISKLFVLSVDKEVVEGAVNSIREELGEEKASRTEWIQCDLSDWKHVAQIAKHISDSTDRVDILVNNAARGVMTHQLTDYGVDRHFAVNHAGHVVLTSHLLPLLKNTAKKGNKVRIVSMASNAHEQVTDAKFESLEELNQDLGPLKQYGRAKLTSILYARYHALHLTKEYPNILHNATHPGVVETAQTRRDIHEPYPRKSRQASSVCE
jgi:NAD(P)-dependent dehydrogenase (short-subunit alcohol dehydrogenase family)